MALRFKTLASGICTGFLFLSCHYTSNEQINLPIPIQPVPYESKMSEDRKLLFHRFPEFVRLQGEFYTRVDYNNHKGTLDIYEDHPVHGKVMILNSFYGLIDFIAYDGAFTCKLDGNPDFIEWKFKDAKSWGKYLVPDGTTPPWPLSNVLESSIMLESELLGTLKEEFDYEVHGEK